MTSTAMPATGASFGDFDVTADWKVTDSTGIVFWDNTRLRNVENSSVRDALSLFDAALSASSQVLMFAGSYRVRQTLSVISDRDIALDWLIQADNVDDTAIDTGGPLEQQAAVTVVNQLVEILGMPNRDVLRAAGIAKSTFYSWDKPDGPRPRVASQGQLWALAETVDDLAEYLGGVDRVGAWILAKSTRRSLMRDGLFDQLLELAAPAAPDGGSVPYDVGRFAAGDEKLEPMISTATSARTRRARIANAGRRSGAVPPGRSH